MKNDVKWIVGIAFLLAWSTLSDQSVFGWFPMYACMYVCMYVCVSMFFLVRAPAKEVCFK